MDTTADFVEATLNSIRRWAEVTVAPLEDAGGTRLTVSVHKERFSGPDRQFNSSGAAYQFFGYNLPSTAGVARVDPEGEHWIDAGRDPAMESYLLDAILASTPLDSDTHRGD